MESDPRKYDVHQTANPDKQHRWSDSHATDTEHLRWFLPHFYTAHWSASYPHGTAAESSQAVLWKTAPLHIFPVLLSPPPVLQFLLRLRMLYTPVIFLLMPALSCLSNRSPERHVQRNNVCYPVNISGSAVQNNRYPAVF